MICNHRRSWNGRNDLHNCRKMSDSRSEFIRAHLQESAAAKQRTAEFCTDAIIAAADRITAFVPASVFRQPNSVAVSDTRVPIVRMLLRSHFEAVR